MNVNWGIWEDKNKLTNKNLKKALDFELIERYDITREQVIAKLPKKLQKLARDEREYGYMPGALKPNAREILMETRKEMRLSNFETHYNNALNSFPIDYDKLRNYILEEHFLVNESGQPVAWGYVRVSAFDSAEYLEELALKIENVN